jgi:hypothetical protein
MLISFADTTGALLSGQKTVTRRRWSDRYFAQWLTAWERKRLTHSAYDRLPLSGGRKVGEISLTCCPYLEKLCDFPESDLSREGGCWETVGDYISFQGGDPSVSVAVIRFIFSLSKRLD